MGNMRFKAGDRVLIKSLDWYNKNKGIWGHVPCGEYDFVSNMSVFCGKILTIDVDFGDETYLMKEDTDGFVFTNEMIEGLVEEEAKPKFKVGDRVITDTNMKGKIIEVVEEGWYRVEFEPHNKIPQSNGVVPEESMSLMEEKCNCVQVDNIPDVIQAKTSSACSHNGFYGYSDSEGNETSEWYLPEGYQFTDENGNVINAKKIVLEKKNIIREEQIDNAAQEYIDSDNTVLTYSDGFCEQTDHPFVRAAFKAGVEWADNNVTQDDCSKAPKLTSQDYSNGRFGYRLPAGFEAKLTERELILTPEKPEYPKTYEECCKVLGYDDRETYCVCHTGANERLFESLYRLKVCRDAYWKIAGDWKPEYPFNTARYVITNSRGFVGKVLTYDVKNYILEFPTAEMRDTFYENFKEFINECKELL